MIHLSPANSPVFQGKNKHSVPKLFLPAVGLFLCMNTASPIYADTFTKQSNDIEVVDSITADEVNPTQLSEEELKAAPSPMVKIGDKEQNVGIVVDVTTNKLYRYDSDGNVMDGYNVASGKIGKDGKSITDTGIRKVGYVETYPYRNAPASSKRRRFPNDYGPNILHLMIVDPKSGEVIGDNGEYIHGNNNSQSIGKHASHGCVRMDNTVIKQLAKEVKPGTMVLIK